MKKTSVLTVIGLFVFTGFVHAAGKDDAKALVNRAAAHAKYLGKEKAIAEISRRRGIFDRSELYVFAYALQRVMIAHPKNPELSGRT